MVWVMLQRDRWSIKTMIQPISFVGRFFALELPVQFAFVAGQDDYIEHNHGDGHYHRLTTKQVFPEFIGRYFLGRTGLFLSLIGQFGNPRQLGCVRCGASADQTGICLGQFYLCFRDYHPPRRCLLDLLLGLLVGLIRFRQGVMEGIYLGADPRPFVMTGVTAAIFWTLEPAFVCPE